MTISKTIIGAYSGGYTLSSSYSPLTITSSASIGGTGLTTQAAATIDNYGQVVATTGGDTGINLAFGGSIVNAGAVRGGNGGTSVVSGGPGFSGGFGVVLASNGALTNGSSGVINGGAGGVGGSSTTSTAGNGGDGRAGVSAGTSTAAVATNSGSIGGGAGGAGGAGGFSGFQYPNGFGGRGGGGIAGVATVVNTGGLITGAAGGAGYFAGAGGYGVDLGFHGSINNSGTITGGAGGAAVAIAGSPRYPGRGGAGGSGVDLEGAATLINSGSILGGAQGAGSAPQNPRSYGVYIDNSGATITNSGLISGRVGLGANNTELFTVTNSGTIASSAGASGTAVKFTSSSDRLIAQSGATFIGAIAGDSGTLEISTGADTITGLGATGTFSGPMSGTFSNFGAYIVDSGATLTLAGSANLLASGRTLTNNGALSVTGSLSNAGSIVGAAAYGVVLTAGGYANNSGFIEGAAGAYVDPPTPLGATLVTSGTIEGATGDSVKLGGSADRLVVQSKAHFIGAVAGGGGTLELAGGSDTINGLGNSGALSGSATASTLGGFGDYVVDSGVSLTLAGANTLASGQTLTNSGTLTLAGALGNAGFIASGSGITLTSSGELTNAGVIAGAAGVYAASGATVINSGTIQGASGDAVQLASASNRLIALPGADFSGAIAGGGGTLELAGGSDSISGLGGAGVISGSVTASSFGGFGSYTIDSGVSLDLVSANTLASAQQMANDGTVTVTGSLANSGSITGTATYGVVLASGGYANNSGFIEGVAGAYVDTSITLLGATLVNSGTIEGSSGDSVKLGGAQDRLILDKGATFIGYVAGGGGVLEIATGADTVTGLGGPGTLSIDAAGTFGGFGTYVLDSGAAWTMTGGNVLAGAKLENAGTLLLDGTLEGSGTISGQGDFTLAAGSYLGASGGDLLLSQATLHAAGATVSAAAGDTLTVDAFFHSPAMIVGGAALTVGAGGEIAVDDGSVIEAAGALANAGVISLASTGSLTDLRIMPAGATLSGGGVVSMSGALPRIVGETASSTLTNVDDTIEGEGYLGAGQLSLANEAGGVIDANLKGQVLGMWMPGGNVANAGLMEATSSGELLIASTTIANAGGTILAAGANVVLQAADVVGGMVGSTGAGLVVASASGATLDGTGAGGLTLTGRFATPDKSTLVLEGAISDKGATVFLGGTKDATRIIIGSAGATLSHGGLIEMSASAFNTIATTGTATLDNVDNRIVGGGTIGSSGMSLINAGFIASGPSAALTISTGAQTIQSSGMIEAQAGGLTITGAVANSGTLVALAGVLTLQGAVSGTGGAVIGHGGTLIAQGTFGEGVIFGSAGTLQLDDSQHYGGTIRGFTTTGSTRLDLRDIAFTSPTEASWSQATHTLTISDGAHVALIHLAGSFANGASAFTCSDDTHGGVLITDPPAGGLLGGPHST